MRRGVFLLACAAAFSLLLGGCAHTPIIDPAGRGLFYKPKNYNGVANLPFGMHRVLLLPAWCGDLMPPETKASLDPIFATALQKQDRFEVVTISREELEKSFGFPEISSAAALPADFLSELSGKYGAQGVLFVDVTSYNPYGPLILGFRAKLADATTRGLLWSYDEIFNTTNPAVANSLRRFGQSADRGSLPFDLSNDALRSPRTFAGFVAETAFHTLPPP